MSYNFHRCYKLHVDRNRFSCRLECTLPTIAKRKRIGFPRRESNPDPKEFLEKWEPYILTVRQRGSYFLTPIKKVLITSLLSVNCINTEFQTQFAFFHIFPASPSMFSIFISKWYTLINSPQLNVATMVQLWSESTS